MPKPYTCPILFDELKTIDINFLRKNGYLKPENWQSGIITWSRGERKTGSISVIVCTLSHNQYIELNYKYNEQPINYRVQLVPVISGLGKGVVWYFICPKTEKRCRKLYLADTYFLHRTAFTGMYGKQIASKKYRHLDKTIGVYVKADSLYEQLYKKYFKKTYAGKPTKKYQRIMQQLNKISGITKADIYRAFS